MKLKLAILLLLSFASSLAVAQHNPASQEFRLHFKEGDLWRVQTTEVLRLMMHFPQVDPMDAKPSIRTTVYSFTYAIEKTLPDGSAVIGATLDSFKTRIMFGEGKHAEDFFHFNSAVDWDLEHTLRDIKTLPRAQFLGQTLRFTMRPDGTVHDFQNLADFHQNAIGKGYDYDMVHAVLSLSDSLRMGQLLEFGFGGLAATGAEYRSPSTATEIPMVRKVSFSSAGKRAANVSVVYSDPQEHIDYLEGIATPMGILKFQGGGQGNILMHENFLKHGSYRDTANVVLAIDIDTVPEEITRLVTTDVTPIPVLRAGKQGGRITVQEIESHEAPVPKHERSSPENSKTIPVDTLGTRAPSTIKP
ncbi:MAG: hypothetical protein Q8922_06280 [Bacteroidota bacterium]|nr:hypothetical protein [Bacteroidota bacterium]MDP4233765.1 hypothetical protein [Bacteroidota bacterium]MDP4242404.1 hypothetical protein [Bacteroidota bacterium]MDP4287526.1 hypothetical protein [Bacteroidota bacterium]